MSERILLVQMADIGDLILSTPAIAALREARPDAHITLLTSKQAAPILEEGLVDEVLLFDKKGFNGTFALLNIRNLSRIWSLRSGNYGTIVFFHHFTLLLGTIKFWLLAKASGAKRILGLQNQHGWFLTEYIIDNGFGAKHEAQYWLELLSLLGASSEPQRARISFDSGVLPISVKRETRIVIHAGGGGYSLARRWDTGLFAEIADALYKEFDAEIVLVGTPNDSAHEVESQMKYQPINLMGKTTLTQLADILRSADLYIGTDSGVTHLAAAVRAPVLAIFGPSNHYAWSPWSPNGTALVLRSAPECSPCIFVEKSIGLRDGCEAKTCMKMVTKQQVLTAARGMLRDEPVPSLQGFPYDARSGRDWHDRIQILGLPVDKLTYRQWLNLIEKWVRTGNRLHHVCTVNPEFMVIAQSDVLFSTILKRADLCIADGVGLLWAAKRLQTPLPERLTGSDGTVLIAREAAKKGWKLFFLGAAEGVAEEAANVLIQEFPQLQIVGAYAGSPAPEEEAAIVEMVNESGADILLVAYGAPKQDKWIARNSPRLKVKMAMGVGGSFDFIAGRVPRAPEKMQQFGLEWLYRLYKEPWRIKRMLRLPRFVLEVLWRGAN
jgi:N-acetylglucosaminyldiphosphoundecaprenol N-acetyl-beta-D-mannosaminyltransferase